MTKAERTKQFIIEKTAPIFNKNGYAGTSINDLTEATGLTKGSIYGNFENKDAVALAAFDYNHSQVVAAIMSRIKERPHAVDKLKAYIAVFGELYTLPVLEFGCPILNTAIESDDTHVALRGKAKGAIDKWYANVESIIKKGQENKEIKKSVNGREFAGAFIALIEGGVMLAKVTGKSEGLEAALKQARKMTSDIKK